MFVAFPMGLKQRVIPTQLTHPTGSTFTVCTRHGAGRGEAETDMSESRRESIVQHNLATNNSLLPARATWSFHNLYSWDIPYIGQITYSPSSASLSVSRVEASIMVIYIEAVISTPKGTPAYLEVGPQHSRHLEK